MIEKALTFVVPGLIYGIGTLGLALILRFLRFPDLTALGSIVVGGITCIFVTNQVGYQLGIPASFLIGGGLGLVTGIITCRLKVQPVLAGIITYTGAFTLGYIMTDGGTIALARTSLFSSVFNREDVLIVVLLAVLLCALAAFAIRTQMGSLMLALTGDARFVRHRHRRKNFAVLLVLFLGNGLVGLAGGLYALKDYSAQVTSHMDFLPFSLGAVFGGNAMASWLANKLHATNPASADPDSLLSESQPKRPHMALRLLSLLISNDRDDSSRLGFLFLVYILGCLFFKELTGLVHANAFQSIHPKLAISPHYQYVIAAALIVFCVWWAGAEEE